MPGLFELSISFDLTTGRVDEQHSLYGFLHEIGVTDNDLAWFREHPVNFDVFGVNFYRWGYGELAQRKNGQLYRVPQRVNGAVMGEVINEVYERYGQPIMVTETSAKGNIAVRARWMDETIQMVRTLRNQNIPVIGYTWFPLFTMVDWVYRRGRRPLSEYLIHLGCMMPLLTKRTSFSGMPRRLSRAINSISPSRCCRSSSRWQPKAVTSNQRSVISILVTAPSSTVRRGG